jgi:hypothetical protein
VLELSKPDIPPSIIFTIIGIILMVGVIYAYERSVFIDELLDNISMDSWELGFIIIMGSYITGSIIEVLMLSKKNIVKFAHITNNVISFIFIFLSFPILSGSTYLSGGGSTALSQVETEMVQWGWYVGLLFIGYLIILFIARRK